MKRSLILFTLLFALVSCSIDDGNPNDFSFEFQAITGHNMPTEFEKFQTYAITVEYQKPNDCHVFNDFYFLSNTNERTIAVITSVDNRQSCTALPVTDEATFNFFVNGVFDHYIFKFWQGTDDNGNDVYQIVEVPVVD